MLENITDKIYTIRGQKVMLDYDLAELYGYTTSAFNQQVKRNIEKFKGNEFMFQLTREEVGPFVMSQNAISPQTMTLNGDLKSQNVISSLDGNSKSPNWGGIRKLPYAFTEQGIYMLMTVLKGELATKQSRALIITFKKMKDYIIENRLAIESRQNLHLASKIANNSENILIIQNEMEKMDAKIAKISIEINDAIKRTEISPILLDFAKIAESKEFLILNGEPARAKETFLDIFSQAKKRIIIIDNYISIKTLRMLQGAKSNMEVIFFSDNIGSCLYASDFKDFRKERPDLKIKFLKTNGAVHDRFIILDNEKIYHCGTSSKDAGKRITIIHEITDIEINQTIRGIVLKMFKNKELFLK